MIKFKPITVLLLLTIILISISCNREQKKSKNLKSNTVYLLSEFKKLGKLQTKLDTPQPGEWLYQYKETGQSYMDYCYSRPVCPNDSVNKIYILPLGTFNEIEMKLLRNTAEFIGIFFMLDVKLLDPVQDKIVPKKFRRDYFDFDQLNTQYVMQRVLEPNIPEDAICYISITNKDLYPSDDWNFVFGQANLTKKVGVSSFFRFKDNQLDSSNYQTCLGRIAKTTAHELCHMFSIKHCRIYACQINGANSMEEADRKPSWLCPECLAKLQWSIKFDLIKRYDKLINFYNKIGCEKEVKFYRESKKLMEVRD